VRYPRAVCAKSDLKTEKNIEIGQGEILKNGEKIAILAFGIMAEAARLAAEELGATLVNMRFIKPLDEKLLAELSLTHKYFITAEDNVLAGGAGSAVNEAVFKKGLKVKIKNLGWPDNFPEHGRREEILAAADLDEKGILNSIRSFLEKE
jgi:1-deoxy-D-xylulose-5-phosphate synthase